ncbi:MAG TPA: hypothetical protein PKK43_05415 [Spirochaetota bacterium]|mgnify:CR=1 FL=1|nr:hypothetical protein [Spirochaetota bacterium]
MAKKVIFPFGIFILLLIVFTIVTAGGICLYTYNSVVSSIRKAETDVKAYVSPLLNACVQIVDSADDKKSRNALTPLFTDYRKSGIVTKAFYVKDDGTIIAHSDSSEATVLNNNIAMDEFTYNIDQIFYPVKQNLKDIYLTDYYLIDRTVPFNKKQIRYLKKYFDKNIDRNGWLICKAVYNAKGNGYGAVGFIVNKSEIYETVQNKFIEGIFLLKVATAGSFVLSLIITLIIYIRYRMIASRTSSGYEYEEVSGYEHEPGYAENPIAEEPVSESDDTPVLHTIGTVPHVPRNGNMVILDAIPVRRKGAR